MSGRATRPPRLALWLLRLAPLGEHRADTAADIVELFHARTESDGRRTAVWRCYADVFSVLMSPASPTRVPRAGGVTGLARDFRYAARLFRHHPAVVTVTAVGLGVGIGVATAAFTFLDVGALRSYGVADPASLARVLRGREAGVSPTWSLDEWQQMRGRTTASALAASTVPFGVTVALERGVERFSPGEVAFVSADFLGVMGGRAMLGRLLSAADDVNSVPMPVVLSHEFWSRMLAEDPAAIGRLIWVKDAPAVVVGVAAAGFTGPGNGPITYWTPKVAAWAPLGAFAHATGAVLQQVRVHARVAPDASPTQAAAELTGLARALSPTPGGPDAFVAIDRAVLRPGGRPTWEGRDGSQLWMMVAGCAVLIALILALACANATNLLLASAMSRQREIGVRLAMGASRARLVRQLVTESVLLSAVGALIGLAVSAALVRVLSSASGLTADAGLNMDLRVFAFVSVLVLVVGVGAGLSPARHGTRGDLLTPLRGDGGGTTAAGAGRLRGLLVGGQAAASCTLLVVAALLVRGAVTAAWTDVGLPADRLLVAMPHFTRVYDDARAAEFWRIAEPRIAALPGIERVGLTEVAPFGGFSHASVVAQGGDLFRINHYAVTPGYLDALEVRVLRGRMFTRAEADARVPVAVISDAVARQFWRGDDPVGQRLPDEAAGQARGAVVIGVVADAVSARLREPGSGSTYVPLARPASASLVVRTTGDAAASAAMVTDALRAVDPALRPTTFAVADRVRGQVDDATNVAMVAGAVGLLALALAVAGTFGVTTFVVGQRRREISVRMAIGATPERVVRQLLRETLRPVAIGTAIGFGLAWLAAGAIRSQLHGVSSHDPIAFAAAAIVLVGSAGVAIAIPARRGAMVDPAPLLRQ